MTYHDLFPTQTHQQDKYFIHVDETGIMGKQFITARNLPPKKIDLSGIEYLMYAPLLFGISSCGHLIICVFIRC
jgi:hypothetical protein